MTNSNINKSKIFMLILGLAMCIALMLGIAMASGSATAFADGETDPRIPVSKITATSDIDEILVYGKRNATPTINITEGSPAQLQTHYNWLRKTETGGWDYYTGDTFMEGTYKYNTQVRIEYAGATTHVLDQNGVTVTVDGVNWLVDTPQVFAGYSFAWVDSIEYNVAAPAGTPLSFIKNNIWNIGDHYISQAITAFSVADGASGGTKPYTFSKVSGPEWLNVAADGTVSGTPTAVGENADLVIRVTDNMSTTAEITLSVGNTYVLPADRTVISVIRATSDIGEILGYGKSVVKPSFTLTEGTQARFSGTMGDWYKKEGTDWKIYNEATFTEGTYKYSDQLRVDYEYGKTHVLNKDGVSVYINDELCADNQIPDGIYDTYSYIYVGTAEYEILGATDITEALVPVSGLVGKVYSGAAQEPTFGGTLARGTDYEVSYAKVASGELGSDGKPVGAGSYSVTVTGKGAYKGSFTKEFVIAKAEQSAPSASLFTTVAPTSTTTTDGKITGITAEMEYRKVGDSTWTSGTGSDVTGLSSGKYQIRFKETDNYNAGAVTEVVVPESGVSSYNLTVTGGTGGGVFTEGTSVTISANAP
ncbi:MAG: MBG domain-containing protein, partial [Eubacteriales bacterium]|nr:MBG domain-containing protein [Eubacteriales bacterium]